MKRLFPFLLLFSCMGCMNREQKTAALLNEKLAVTPILSSSFDSMLQEVQKLPPRQRVESWIRISNRNEEEMEGIVKQEYLLFKALSTDSKKGKKKALLQLIAFYARLDKSGFPNANSKGIQRCDELEMNYSLSQEEHWKAMEIRASLLNRQGQQEQYLSIRYQLLKEHRKADKTELIIQDLNYIANHFIMLGNQEEGLALYKEAYQLATEKHLTAQQAECTVIIINILYDLGRYQEIIDNYHQVGIDSIVSLMPSAHTMLANCYLQLHKPDSARMLLPQAVISKSKGKIAIDCLLAETYLAQGREDSVGFFLDRAMKQYQKQAKYSQGQNIEVFLPKIFLPVYFRFADLLQKKDKTRQASEAFSLVAPLMAEPAHTLPQLGKQIDALTRYGSFCRDTGQYTKALNLFARRDSIREIYDTLLQKRDNKNLVGRFKTQELIHTNEIKDIQLQDSNRLLAIVSVLASILLVALVGIIYLYRNWRKQLSITLRQNQELRILRAYAPEEKQEQSPNQLEGLFHTAQEKVISKKLFLNKNLTIGLLAKELDTNRSYLSSCINTCSGGNFNQWINTYRIGYVLERIHSTGDIQRLIDEAGFVSHDVFYRNFKRCTQLTPGQYLKQHTS